MPSFLRSKRNILIFIILVLGLISSLYLVTKQQFLSSKAGPEAVKILDQNSNPLPLENENYTTESQDVILEISPPVKVNK